MLRSATKNYGSNKVTMHFQYKSISPEGLKVLYQVKKNRNIESKVDSTSSSGITSTYLDPDLM